jgi:hypothetical protein
MRYNKPREVPVPPEEENQIEVSSEEPSDSTPVEGKCVIMVQTQDETDRLGGSGSDEEASKVSKFLDLEKIGPLEADCNVGGGGLTMFSSAVQSLMGALGFPFPLREEDGERDRLRSRDRPG